MKNTLSLVMLLISATCAVAQTTPALLPHVPDNLSLETAPPSGGFNTAMVRDGLNSAGDSIGSSFYVYSTSACSLGGGSGDNLTQVSALGGGCWHVNSLLSLSNNTGNIIVNGSYGSGGNIGLDNNHALFIKDAAGSYRNVVQVSGSNDLWLGSTNFPGNIQFFNNGVQSAILDTSGNLVVRSGVYSSGLNVNGSATISSGLGVSGNASLNGLSVSGNTSLNGVNNTSGFYNFPHGEVGYAVIDPGTSVILANLFVDNTFFAARDDGSILVEAASGGYACTMNSTVAPNWGCGSDARLKDTSPLPDETQSVLRLKPVAFTWKSDPDKHPHLGFTAQDVERYFPQLVYTDPHAGTKMLATEGLIAPLVKTIQELAARIDVLEREVKAMQVRP